MNVPELTTADVAARLHISTRKVTKTAREIGVGHDFGGRVGFRFTDEDVATMLASFRVEAEGAA